MIAALLALTAPLSIDLANCRLAAEYSAARKGISMLVMVDGKIIFEDYPNGGSRTRAHELASGTKSFTGVMAAAAAQDGLLSFDERASDTLTEWKSDPQKSKITLRQMLDLSSGLPPGELGQPPSYADAISRGLNAAPGERFQYGPTSFQAFGEVMRRKLKGESPLDYMKRRIFEPIGMEYQFWRKGLDGNPHLPSGARLTAPDWAKFGELVRLGGTWNGKRVVDQELLDQCFKPSPKNSIYGLTWWLAYPGSNPTRGSRRFLPGRDDITATPGVPKDIVFAGGAGDQRLYVSRQGQFVVVSASNRN